MKGVPRILPRDTGMDHSDQILRSSKEKKYENDVGINYSILNAFIRASADVPNTMISVNNTIHKSARGTPQSCATEVYLK